MGTLLLRSGLSKAKRAKNHVEEGLEKVRAKPWAEPLGKALEASGKIVGAVDGFVPGANIIGGALSFGATLLNPEPSPKDLLKELREIREAIEGSKNATMTLALERAKQELEDKIAHPVGEIKVEFKEVRVDVKRILKEVGNSDKKMTAEVSKIRDMVSQTFHVVVDSRFKVSLNLMLLSLIELFSQDGIEKVDAAYTVFLRSDFEDFQSYSFEMQTVAIQNLNPERVKEYLEIIYQQQGLVVCQV